MHNFPEIVHYYSEIKKKVKNLSTIQQNLVKYFVDKEEVTKLTLLFIYSATQDMVEKIDYFEKKAANVYNTK